MDRLDELAGVAAALPLVSCLHPALARLYPLVLAQGDQMTLYDQEPGAAGYVRVAVFPAPMPIPPGVRAAFPLEAYNNRMVCVVTGDIFDEPDGTAVILHEFIHCWQGEGIEAQLKETLSIERQNPMWEILYPFPYNEGHFIARYEAYRAALLRENLQAVARARGEIQRILQYMAWQEWKEGLARFLENRVRQVLGFAPNRHGVKGPCDRVAFYASGAGLMEQLSERYPGEIPGCEANFSRLLENNF
jgi:hypothetical protein